MTPTLTELAQTWVEAALEADRVHSLDLNATDKRNHEAECKAAFLTAAVIATLIWAIALALSGIGRWAGVW